jgi:aspartokinase-like uncharacterized kinase
MIDVVAKVGGSLGRGANLRALCLLLAEMGRERRLLVVPGGGPFADTVRDCDNRYGLSDSASHWMAVLAMEQFGCLLSDLIPRSEPARDPDAARQIALSGRVPVLMPFDLVRRADPLPHTWLVTSDSISAWVAELVKAPILVLLKSVDGLSDCLGRSIGDRALPGLFTLEQLARWEGVDPYLATILAGSGLDVWIISGDTPERFKELMTMGTTLGSRLQR